MHLLQCPAGCIRIITIEQLVCCKSNILAYPVVTCSSSHTQWNKICCVHPTYLPSREQCLFVFWKPSLEFTLLIKKGKRWREREGERVRHRCPAHSTLPATLPINVPGFPCSHMLCCFDVTKRQLHSAASFYGKNIFKRADERDPISRFVSHYFNCIYIEHIIYRGKLLSSL